MISARPSNTRATSANSRSNRRSSDSRIPDRVAWFWRSCFKLTDCSSSHSFGDACRPLCVLLLWAALSPAALAQQDDVQRCPDLEASISGSDAATICRAIAPAAVIAQGSGQPSDTHPGRALFKGSDYLRMPPDEQLGYVSGVIDGILFHSPFVDIFEHCFERLRPTPDLLKTIADRYLESEPKLQQADMRFLVFHATLLTCQGVRQLPN